VRATAPELPPELALDASVWGVIRWYERLQSLAENPTKSNKQIAKVRDVEARARFTGLCPFHRGGDAL
jgi:hypothetical protein